MLGLLLITAAGYGADPSVGPNGVPYALPPTNVGSMCFTTNWLVSNWYIAYPTNITITQPDENGTNCDPRMFYHFTIRWANNSTSPGLLSTLHWEAVTNWYDTGHWFIASEPTIKMATTNEVGLAWIATILKEGHEYLSDSMAWVEKNYPNYEYAVVESNLVAESIWNGKTNTCILESKPIKLIGRSYVFKTVKEYTDER